MLADTSPEVKLAALKALKAIARAVPDEILNPFLDLVVMAAFACQRDKVTSTLPPDNGECTGPHPLKPEPYYLDPNSQTLNPEPQTPNPKPETRTPKP